MPAMRWRRLRRRDNVGSWNGKIFPPKLSSIRFEKLVINFVFFFCHFLIGLAGLAQDLLQLQRVQARVGLGAGL